MLAAAVLLLLSESITYTSAAAEPILIIDAGHGGEDGGAVAPDGTLESDLNLEIARRLEALAAFWGVDTRMTRDTAAIDYPPSALTLAAKKRADQDARIELINLTPGGILISIHQNTFPASAPNGIQVFYAQNPGSADLAGILQENMTAALCPENRRLAASVDEDIYLMRKAQCCAVLIECGFLSNPGELEKLKTDSYHVELAAVMLASYLQYIRGISA